MFEVRTDTVPVEAADATTDVQQHAPADAESAALVGDLREAPAVTDAERDNEALRTAPDAVAPEDSGEVRIPRQHGEAGHPAHNGKASAAAGSLTMHEVTARGDQVAASTTDRYSGAQARYERGMIPLAVGAKERAARLENDTAARLHQHHVDAATGEAWHMLGQQSNGDETGSSTGIVSRIAAKTGGSLESANAGLMRATLLRLDATTTETRTSSRGQGTDQHLDGEPQREATTAEQTGKAEKISLTLQLNQLQHELTRTDRPLIASKRAELQEAHDRTLTQLRDQMRAEQQSARDATVANLHAYFENTNQDPETVVMQMLVRAGQDHDSSVDGLDSREEFGAMALASYAGLRGLSPLSSFPDAAPSALDLLAMDASDKEHAYVQQVARHGVGSRRASTALDAAYEADRMYAAALNQARAAEYAARSGSPSTARHLDINPLGN